LLFVFTLHLIQVPASLPVEYPIAIVEVLCLGVSDTVPISTSVAVLTVTAEQSRIKDSITILLFRVVLSEYIVTPVTGVNIPVPEIAVKSLL
jgi:hypothetical protein